MMSWLQVPILYKIITVKVLDFVKRKPHQMLVQKQQGRASPVNQWLRLHLPVQGA